MITSQQLLTEMRDKGLTLECVDNKLQVKPARLIDDGMADLIKANKDELIKLLNPDSEITNHWWLLQFKDGETRQACTWPHSTKVEMLKLNPDAVTAEPIPSPID